MSFTLPYTMFEVQFFSCATYVTRTFYPIFIYNKHILIQNHNLYIHRERGRPIHVKKLLCMPYGIRI